MSDSVKSIKVEPGDNVVFSVKDGEVFAEKINDDEEVTIEIEILSDEELDKISVEKRIRLLENNFRKLLDILHQNDELGVSIKE